MVWRENGASPKSILYKTEVGERGRRAPCPDSWRLIIVALGQKSALSTNIINRESSFNMARGVAGQFIFYVEGGF